MPPSNFTDQYAPDSYAAAPGPEPGSDDESLDQDVQDGEEGEAQAQQESPPEKGPSLKEIQRRAEEYEARFKGLQPVVQRHAEEANRLRAHNEQLERQLVEYRLSLLPEEQRHPQMLLYQAQVANQKLESQRQQEQGVMNEVLKEHTIGILSQQYGVPKEKLSKFSDPYAMEDFSKAFAELRQEARKATKGTRRADRAADGADRFEGGGSPPASGAPPSSMEEGAAAFAAGLRRMTSRR